MAKEKVYWVLEVRWESGGKWYREFGDFERSVVVFERRDYLDSYGRNGSGELRATDVRVVRGETPWQEVMQSGKMF